jgi:TolA-binding protein
MRRILLLSSFLLPLSLYAEKSAFGAGDLNNPSPYGLTKAEKYILDNKETINDIEGTVRKNRSRIGSLEESLSGVKSIVEGLNEKGRNENLELQSLKGSSVEMNEKIDEIILRHDENIKQLKTVMGELSSLIDTINSRYVSKEEYNTLATEINSFKLEVAKQLKKIAKGGSNPLDNKSNAQVAKDAEGLFKKKQYADAIDHYEHLIVKNYKPAAAHYYIGESYFQLNEYKNAVAYFKESAKRYSKASYMPNLMLHTAISLEKSNDKEGARQFFQALIAKYPDSSEAKKASKLLK